MRTATTLLLASVLTLFATFGCTKAPPTVQEQLETLYKSGDWIGAIDLSTKLLEEDGKNTHYRYVRAQSYLALKMYQDSIDDYTLLIKAEPDKPDHYYGRALAHRRAGNIPLANADGDRGREIDTTYKTAYAYDMDNFRNHAPLPGEKLDPEEEDGESDNDSEREGEVASNEADGQQDVGGSEGEGLATLDQIRQINPWEESEGNESPLFSNEDFDHGPLGDTANVPGGDGWGDVGNADDDPALADLEDGVAGELAERLKQLEAANLAENGAANVADNRVNGAEEEAAARNGGDGLGDVIAERIKEKTDFGDRLNEDRKPFGDDFVPPIALPQRPTISMALPQQIPTPSAPGVARPLGMPAAPGVVTPRATGISSAAPPVGTNLTPTTTGIPSNGSAFAQQPNVGAGIQPGQFQGNTIYQPGTAPVLSTALPGTAPQVQAPSPGFVPNTAGNVTPNRQVPQFSIPRGPTLSTSLPADRMVTPGARPTGIISGQGVGVSNGPATNNLPNAFSGGVTGAFNSGVINNGLVSPSVQIGPITNPTVGPLTNPTVDPVVPAAVSNPILNGEQSFPTPFNPVVGF